MNLTFKEEIPFGMTTLHWLSKLPETFVVTVTLNEPSNESKSPHINFQHHL